MFDNSVFNKIETLEPSARGEYEVTDLCNIYVSENKCLAKLKESIKCTKKVSLFID